MGKIRVGIIGAGGMAQKHLDVIRGSGLVDPVGIISRTRAKAEALARQFDIPLCSDSIEGLVQEAKPDALMVLVTETQTARVVEQVLPYRLPLFIEKPPALSCEDSARLAEAARRYAIPTMVGYNRRYYSIFHQGLEVIRRHGKLRAVVVEGHERMWRIRAGGKFSDEVMAAWIFANSTHTIDLLRFFGGDVVSLASVARARLEKNGDHFAAVMQLDSGAAGQYNAFWYSPGGWSVRLYGDGVTVEFQPLEKGRWIDQDFQSHEILPDEMDTKYKCGFYGQLQAFEQLVRTGQKQWPLADLADAHQTMLLVRDIARGTLNFAPLETAVVKESTCAS